MKKFLLALVLFVSAASVFADNGPHVQLVPPAQCSVNGPTYAWHEYVSSAQTLSGASQTANGLVIIVHRCFANLALCQQAQAWANDVRAAPPGTMTGGDVPTSYTYIGRSTSACYPEYN